MLDKAGIDVLLVEIQHPMSWPGHETTLPITLDQMIYHAQSVVRGVERKTCGSRSSLLGHIRGTRKEPSSHLSG